MVKKPKDVKILEDVRIFAVHLPYPLYTDLVNEEDQIATALWVAEVIGNPNHLLNIYRMPSARGMILLEISKEFTDQGLLLGEHQWQRFLKNPSPEEVGRKTGIFYSTFPGTQEVRKAGWCAIYVQARWFKDWCRGQGAFVHPYPETSWCPPPPEDKTNRLVCRPLPVEYKPPPPSVDRPVVGSPAWIARQQEEKLTKEVLKSAWKNQNLSIKVGEASSKPTAPPSAASGKARNAVSGAGPQTPNPTPLGSASGSAKPVWGKPVPLNRFASNPRSASSGQAPWAGQIKKPASDKSPFTEKPPVGPQNAWKKALKIVPEKPPKVIPYNAIENSEWATPSADSWFDIAEGEFSSYSTDFVTGIEASIAHQSAPENAPPIPMTGNVNSSNKGQTPKRGNSATGPEQHQQGTSNLAAYYALDDDEDDEAGLEDILQPLEEVYISEHGSTTGDDDTSPATPPEDTTTSNKKVIAEDEWETTWAIEEDPRKEQAPEIICPTHKLSCPRKICPDYCNEEKRVKRIKEMEARLEEDKNRRGNGRGRARGWGGNRNRCNRDEGDNQNVEADDGFQVARARGRRW